MVCLMDIQRILTRSFPARRIHSLEPLEGGATNKIFLVRLEGNDEMFVLRQFLRGVEACRKEVRLLQVLRALLPVPELIEADITGNEAGVPYLVYRFVPGITFRQVRANGSPQDMADAAHAIGHCLEELQRCNLPVPGTHELERRHVFTGNDLNCLALQERLETGDLLLLQELFVKWSPLLHALSKAESLVHGDFNHRNIVLDCRSGQWKVAGILDWELASIGSSLWDTTRFICYEKPDSAYWESHFVNAFQTSDIDIPHNWKALSCVINTLSAAESLANSSTQERFIPGLKRLIHSGLRGKRIG